ncbi:MAG: mercury transporter MerT [Rhizobiales bacterium]|nr:mercury transporter MerT [Hyphomicrobiales bacterium]
MAGRSQPLRAMVDPASGQAGQRLAVAGGLLGAIAASSCCILPLLLFSVGAGGAWIGHLTALAPYQPVFVVITLGLLVYGFWLVYRKRDAVCTKGGACARPLPKRLVKAGLWAATAIIAAALAFPYAAPVLLET